jgi:hypothetical protein
VRWALPAQIHASLRAVDARRLISLKHIDRNDAATLVANKSLFARSMEMPKCGFLAAFGAR